MGSGASAQRDEEHKPIACTLKALPEALETVVFVHEKWPMVIDPSGQAGRFLRYQRGSFLLADSPADMAPDHLRALLVGALKHGSTMCIAFGALGGAGRDMEHVFSPGFFPRELVEGKGRIFDPAVRRRVRRCKAPCGGHRHRCQ